MRGGHGANGMVDQQPTAGPGQGMIMPGPVEFGGVMQEEGVTGQTWAPLANAADQTAPPEAEVQVGGVERHDHAPWYMDGSAEEESAPAPRPKALGRKSRTPMSLRCGLPASLTEPRPVARFHESAKQSFASQGVDDLTKPVTVPASLAQDRTTTEPSLPPQQMDGFTDQTRVPEQPIVEQDAFESTAFEQHTDDLTEQTAHSESEYSQHHDTAVATEASSLGIEPLEPTIVHEPHTFDQDAKDSPPIPCQPDGLTEQTTIIPDSVTHIDDTPQSDGAPQQTADATNQIAGVESLVQQMVVPN
jgi:hypothetical protein